MSHMSAPSSDFRTLLEQARCGDEGALTEIVGRYEHEVRLVVKSRLSRALRPYLDSIDLIQSVHKSLIIGLRDDRFDISDPQQLVALATTIVRRKIAKKWRKMHRQTRASGGALDEVALRDLLVTLSDPAIDPSHEAEMREQIAVVLRNLGPLDRRLLELRLEGFSTADAARELQCDPDSLRVRLSRLRQRLIRSGVANDLL
jgi:RNA polymerase sigma-70 factor (ECF subfamily)